MALVTRCFWLRDHDSIYQTAPAGFRRFPPCVTAEKLVLHPSWLHECSIFQSAAGNSTRGCSSSSTRSIRSDEHSRICSPGIQSHWMGQELEKTSYLSLTRNLSCSGAVA